MAETNSGETKARFILTKAYEIAYALFRLAAQMTENDFAERLRATGAGLLSATAGEDYGVAGKSLRVTECLIKFAGDVNLIGVANSEVILREVYALDAAIEEMKRIPKADTLNIVEIFSKAGGAVAESIEHEPEPAKESTVREPAMNESANEGEYGNPANQETTRQTAIDAVSEDTGPQNINAILKSAIRQTAILDKIRQSGNCRLKDLQEVLPEVSERTLRYDLQTLLEQNQIERVGIAGPSVYYRVRQGT